MKNESKPRVRTVYNSERSTSLNKIFDNIFNGIQNDPNYKETLSKTEESKDNAAKNSSKIQ